MKTSKELKTEIENIERTLLSMDTELNEKVRLFASLLPAAAETWIRTEVQRKIEESSSKVEEMGILPLKQLKTDLTDLISGLPDICAKAVENEQLWPHKISIFSNVHNSSAGGSYFADVFRNVISHLGNILDKHGLLKPKREQSQSWEKISLTEWRYCINPGFDERNFPPLVSYRTLRANHIQVTAELERMRQEFSKAKAREMWESA